MKTTKTSFKTFWKNFPTFSKLREKEKQAVETGKTPGMPPAAIRPKQKPLKPPGR